MDVDLCAYVCPGVSRRILQGVTCLSPQGSLLNVGGGKDGWIVGGTVYSVNILSGSSLDEDK